MNPMIYISVVRSRSDYYPFGTRTGTYAEAAAADGRWRFSGKEWQAEPAGLPLLDFGARMYDPATAVWLSQDPMAEKYPSLSPYSYCAGDPVNLIDEEGRRIIIPGRYAQTVIKYTVPNSDYAFLSFNGDGVLDNTLLQESTSSSNVMSALKMLSNSEVDYIYNIYEDAFGDKFYDDKKGNFYYGVTLMPSASNNPSPDSNVYVFTASFLSEEKKVANAAHELYGHAYFYELKKQGRNVNPNHTRAIIGYGTEKDSLLGELQYPIYGNTNQLLEETIEKMVKESLENYFDRINE